MTIMVPLAVALDILQEEEKCDIGTIFPTIRSFEKKFKKLKDLVRFCHPLVYALLLGLEKRLSTILDERLFHAKD